MRQYIVEVTYRQSSTCETVKIKMCVIAKDQPQAKKAVCKSLGENIFTENKGKMKVLSSSVFRREPQVLWCKDID